ncbi:FG-GAP repeat domain-containing protein [Lentzea sp. NPDC102401]|uniref:FG-GAP repeat domain-containing protein n=1 Tax=Lentzea sp. NPDC102401 TaxID=3364128 RepID=UPI0037F3D07E
MASRLIVAVLLLAIGVCSAGEPQPVSGAVYSYVTSNEVVVMRGAKAIVRWSRPQNGKLSRVVWTADGRRAAFLTGDKNRELIVVDVFEGRVRTLKCLRCTTLAAMSGSRVLVAERSESWTDDSYFGGLLRFDLARDEPPVQLPDMLPGLRYVALFSGADETLLMGVDGNTEAYYRVRVDGKSERLGSWNNRRTGRDGKTFHRGLREAVQTGDVEGRTIHAIIGAFGKAGECESAGEVFVAVPDRNALVGTDFTAAEPKDTSVAASVNVLSTWWDKENRLHSAVHAKTCDGDRSMLDSTGEWLLDRGRWTQVSHELLFSVRLLTDGASAVATLRDSGSADAVLELRHGDRRVHVADGVEAVDAPAAFGRGDVADDLCAPSDAVCLAQVGGTMVIGTARADLDGDGAADEVSVSQSWPSAGTLTLTADVDLGDKTVRTILPQQMTAVQWLGAADITGDGRAELFVPFSNGAHTTIIQMYEYADGSFHLIDGDLKEVAIGQAIYESSGFTCMDAGIRVSLAYADWSATDLRPAGFVLHETTYVPDQSGVLRKADVHTTKITDAEMPASLQEQAGAHCPGMARFPH